LLRLVHERRFFDDEAAMLELATVHRPFELEANWKMRIVPVLRFGWDKAGAAKIGIQDLHG
jgi:hypothetical protein